MDWIWVIGIVVVMIVAALVWWLFSRNSSSTEAAALAHSPTILTHGPAGAAGQNPLAGHVPAADRGPAAGPELTRARQPATTSHREDDGGAEPTAASPPPAQGAEATAGATPASQAHVADVMYEEEVSGTASDEDLVVEETMPDSPGASGTTTAQGAGAEEPPPAEVEDAAAEQSPPTAEPLYDETEWLGYAGEAVIEPSVAAENGDGPDRRRG
ncbi:MAG: hypothetical protein ACQEXN_05945 [Actinomycetota bacterium]